MFRFHWENRGFNLPMGSCEIFFLVRHSTSTSIKSYSILFRGYYVTVDVFSFRFPPNFEHHGKKSAKKDGNGVPVLCSYSFLIQIPFTGTHNIHEYYLFREYEPIKYRSRTVATAILLFAYFNVLYLYVNSNCRISGIVILEVTNSM